MFNSCFSHKKNGVEVIIENESAGLISNVEFTTTERVEVIKMDKIDCKKRISKFLSMSKNKTDGSYILAFNRENGKKEIVNCGYYSNGYSFDHWIDFIVKKDTVIVKFSPIY